MRVRTAAFADLLEHDGEAVVLLSDGRGLVRLSAVGTAMLELAVNGVDTDTLAGALERRFGVPPDVSALAMTETMVTALISQGLLEPAGDTPAEAGVRWRISDDTAFVASNPDRVVVLNLADPSASPKALPGSAASIWALLAGTDAERRPWVREVDLITELADVYATAPAAIADDVRGFLTDLAGAGYLRSTGGSGG